MTTRVFLSHSKADRKWTLQLRDHFVTAGLDVFIDESIEHGDNWLQNIRAELTRCDWFCLVVSPESVASRWCRLELDAFLTSKKTGTNIQLLLRWPAPLDAITSLVQHTRDPLTPENYGDCVRALVNTIAGRSAADRLPQRLVNPNWDEVGRIAITSHRQLQGLVASILAQRFATDALATALKLPNDWMPYTTNGADDCANTLLVAWKDHSRNDWATAALALLDVLEQDDRKFLDSTESKAAAAALRATLQRRNEAVTVAGSIAISRITDVDTQADDLLEALAVYSRIPTDERIEDDELLELTRNHLAYGFGAHWEQYFVLARCNTRIVGMLVAYDDLKTNYTFVSGLAVRRPNATDPSKRNVSRQLLTELLRLRAVHGDPNRALRIVAEVDDPAQTRDVFERRKRCSRLRLFASIAQLDRMELRVPELEFLQPSLRGQYDIEPRHLLLIYAESQFPPSLPRDQIRELLRWVFREIYPADTCAADVEQAAYKEHARSLMHRVLDGMPEEVRMRRVAEVLATECDGKS